MTVIHILYRVNCDESVEFIGATYNGDNAKAAMEYFECDYEEIEIKDVEIGKYTKILNDGFDPHMLVVSGGRIEYVYPQYRNLMPNSDVNSIEFRSRSINEENFWTSGVIYIWGKSGVGAREIFNRANVWYEEHKR